MCRMFSPKLRWGEGIPRQLNRGLQPVQVSAGLGPGNDGLSRLDLCRRSSQLMSEELVTSAWRQNRTKCRTYVQFTYCLCQAE